MNGQTSVHMEYFHFLKHVEALESMLQNQLIKPEIYQQIENNLATFELWGAHKQAAMQVLHRLAELIPHEISEKMPHLSRLISKNIHPYFSQNPFCFVFATNDNYAPYLGVALWSLKMHTAQHNICDVCILHTDLSLKHQASIKSLQNENFSIRFINITSFLSDLDVDIFKTHAHFSKEAYYRFFIPKIFINYQKVVYLDCDMLFLKNITELLNINLKNMPMAAVLEYKFKCKVEFDEILNNYAKNVLKLVDVQKYFNSGLLIFDIKKLNEINFTKKCIEKLIEVQRPRTVDQCIINSVMQENITFLNPIWNLQTHVELEELIKFVPSEDFKSYTKALQNPYIIHYCSPIKPWNSQDIPFSKLWWSYAQKTIFYENILNQRS